MNLFRSLEPKPIISEQDRARGLRWFTWEGAVSLGFNSITTSGFLAAFALALGANNFQIGILAAIPFLMHIMQVPVVWVIEKVRRRKEIAVLSWFPAQLLWLPIALIPLFVGVPSALAISLLLWLMTARGFLNAVCNAAWNGWVRDLVPQTILGSFFSKRLIYSTGAAMVFSLLAAFFVDYWRGHFPGEEAIMGYTYVLLFGAIFLGLASPLFMSLTPEPLMQSSTVTQVSLWQRIYAPFKDANFRKLMRFLLFWGFASNLAIPFFAVYMLQRLGLPLTWVIGLSILSLLFNIFFLRVWGRFVDRFGSKAVLSLCTSLYLLVILGWVFTTMPERYFLTMPLLVILHIFAGIANAGVTITLGTIGLKLAPQGESTSYLAGASLATNLGAGLGPLCGGLLANFFSTRQLNLFFTWVDPSGTVQLPALNLSGLDFIFVIAFVVGGISLSTLAAIREEGEMGREVVLESLFFPTREISRPMSSVPAYNLLANFPLGFLKRVHIPVPGVDVALGVTAYQIEEMTRAVMMTAISGQKLSRKLIRSLNDGLTHLWKGEEDRTYGVEVARQAALGAIRATNNVPLDMEKFMVLITSGVVEVTSGAGMKPIDGIVGASQGIIQGAVETEADLEVVTAHVVEAARRAASQTGLSEKMAVAKSIEGALDAAEALGPDTLARVKKALAAASLSEHDK